MEIKNLRIGNLLTWKDKEVSTEAILTYIGGVLNDCIWLEWVWADGEADNTDCDLDSVKGIEITDDWLIDFGFIKDNNGNYWVDLQNHYLELISSNGYWYPVYAQVTEMSHQDEQRVSTNRIQYVHELQNLFFAITGSELELKTESKHGKLPIPHVSSSTDDEEPIDIYAPEGTKVKYTGRGGYDRHKEHANKHLKVDEIYTIDHTDVGGWHTDVYLKEVPNEAFNSVHFVNAE